MGISTVKQRLFLNCTSGFCVTPKRWLFDTALFNAAILYLLDKSGKI